MLMDEGQTPQKRDILPAAIAALCLVLGFIGGMGSGYAYRSSQLQPQAVPQRGLMRPIEIPKMGLPNLSMPSEFREITRFKPALVTNVVDGDTIDVVAGLGMEVYHTARIRIFGVDTPEMRSKDENERKRAREAKKFVEDQILDKNIVLILRKKDSFGRYLASVLYMDKEGKVICELSEVLLKEGLAEVYKK